MGFLDRSGSLRIGSGRFKAPILDMAHKNLSLSLISYFLVTLA